MNAPQHFLNDQLTQVLQKQLDAYAQIQPLAEELSDCYDLGKRSQQLLQQLNALVLDAVKRDEQILGLRTRLDGQHAAIGEKAKRVSSELAGRIRHVMHLFDSIENKAIAARDQLKPRVNHQIQAQKMKSAYDSQSDLIHEA